MLIGRRAGCALFVIAATAFMACTPSTPTRVTEAPPSASSTRPPLPVVSFGPLPPGTTPLPGRALDQLAAAPSRWTGSNADVEEWAHNIQGLLLGAKIASAVHVDATPSYQGTLAGSRLTAYRESVKDLAVVVVLTPAGEVEWSLRTPAGDRSRFVDSTVRALRSPIDSYPNAQVRVVFANDRGSVLALGVFDSAQGRAIVSLAD